MNILFFQIATGCVAILAICALFSLPTQEEIDELAEIFGDDLPAPAPAADECFVLRKQHLCNIS